MAGNLTGLRQWEDKDGGCQEKQSTVHWGSFTQSSAGKSCLQMVILGRSKQERMSLNSMIATTRQSLRDWFVSALIEGRLPLHMGTRGWSSYRASQLPCCRVLVPPLCSAGTGNFMCVIFCCSCSSRGSSSNYLLLNRIDGPLTIVS